MTALLDLSAARNETWLPTIDYAYSGGAMALAGATIRMQWRLYEGAPGAPLIDLTPIPFQDIEATLEDIELGAARPGDRILRISPGITQTALTALPSGLNNPEPGDADRFVHDLRVTYSDGTTDTLVAGFVYLNKGVTI